MLKNKIILTFCAMIALTGCSLNRTTIDSNNIPTIKDDNQLIEETEKMENKPIVEEEMADSESLLENDYYVEKYPLISSINNIIPLSMKDSVTLDTSLQVAIDEVKVIEDANGSGRTGMVVIFSYQSDSSQTLDTFHDVIPSVIKGDYRLSEHYVGNGEPVFPGADGAEIAKEYIENRYIKFDSEEMEACRSSNEIAPGESGLCYLVYDYIDQGDYLVVWDVAGKYQVVKFDLN